MPSQKGNRWYTPTMKTILEDGQRLVLRFDPDEEVVAGIVDACEQRGIGAAWVQMIGASKSATLSYYDLASKVYEDHVFEEDLEVTGIVGNVALFNGEPVVHAHGTFGRRDFSTVAGHVKRLVVSATMEVYLHALPGKLSRAYDERTGLNLMS